MDGWLDAQLSGYVTGLPAQVATVAIVAAVVAAAAAAATGALLLCFCCWQLSWVLVGG